MEDSLEDFIKLVRNTKESVNKQTTAELRQKDLATLQRKKECESRAGKIVEFLIEGKLRPEVFLRCLKHINQSYYQDIVEERAIEKCCGYPLCGKQIPEMPKKQYFIDSKNNRVYDVTDRKNYCSNFCYKASIHIKQQIDDSPLWVRNIEKAPQFNLLPETESFARGIPGEEIGQDATATLQPADFTSVSSFAAVSLDELTEIEVNGKKTAHKPAKKGGKSQQFMETVRESNEECETPKNEAASTTNIDKVANTSQTNPSISSVPNTTIIGVKTNNPIDKPTPRRKVSSIQSKPRAKSESSKDVLEDLKKCVLEWLTLETYIFLYGNARVKEVLSEKQLQECFQSLQITESSTLQKKRYLEICRKLSLNQLAEDKFDSSVVGSQIKPVPDFKTLKQESKSMDLKVHSFYSGLSYEVDEKINSKDKLEVKETDSPVESQSSEGALAVLPLVDGNSQTAMRRKVFLTSVQKAVGTVVQNLGVPAESILEDLQLLVKTFKLQAHSVVFKPVLWNLIALILIKMLGIRDANLKKQLETKRSETFIALLLSRFPNAEALFCELFENIGDINLFFKQNFSEVS